VKLRTKAVLWGIGIAIAFGLIFIVRIVTGRWKSIGKDLNRSAVAYAKVKVDALYEKRKVIEKKLGANDKKVIEIDQKIKQVRKDRVVAQAKVEGKTDEEVIALLDDLGY